MKIRTIAVASLLFVSGIAASHAAQQAGPANYRGKDKQEAALALLEVAKAQAGKGSWERIAVARIYYLGGMKPQGKAIFDDVLAHDPESSDLFRIARIYRQAGEWELAKALLERSVRENPKDSKGMAELGAYYLLADERAAAEDLFDRSFKREDELWSTVAAAGAYLGVAPQE
ncbi:tetratricopeptide repeat protein [Pseudoxanthomonas gei]|nr:tetratricopeptide repeat protein [Pseudoxanthomonas gei]